MTAFEERVQGIRTRLAEIQARITQACERASRSPETVTLVAVTKTFPLEVVQAGYAAGLRNFGENRVQELVTKAQPFPGTINGGDIRWHMIGPLQRNKAKWVTAHADVFHTLDSLRLAEALNKRATARGRTLPCMVQVNISGEATKSGISPAETAPFLKTLTAYEHLKVQGLMGMPAPSSDPESARPALRNLRILLETAPVPLSQLSMGMSNDFEVAIEEGATHIRIGSALFGSRSKQPLRNA